MKEQDTIKSQVLTILSQAIDQFLRDANKNVSKELLKVKIEYSRNEKFGDYSTSFLLENKEALGNPDSNQELLVSILRNNFIFSDVNFTKPGFINFRINSDFLIDYIDSCFFKENKKNLYPVADDKQKIIFEFVSANPTGPLNIVSARAAATGDSICNLLARVGNEVHREFYVNDYGNQVLLLGASCLVRLREKLGEAVNFQEETDTSNLETLLNTNTIPFEGYRGEYIKDIVETVYSDPGKKSIIDSKLKNKEYVSLAELFSGWAVETNLNSQKQDLVSFGVNFDEFYSEKSLHDRGAVLSVLDSLKKAGDIKVEEGKTLFLSHSNNYGDDKDRVVVREDGRPTYLLADIAYHKTKIDRGFTKVLNIWGPDHHGYIARLKGAMQSLGHPEEGFKVLIAQQVNLISKGEKVKMSKRLGQFQTMKDLLLFLGEASKDIGRYFFVMRSLDAPLDFDLDLAKEESDKNPVFYIQYAYARICSIFRETGDAISIDSAKKIEMTEERRALLFWIARFPEEVLDAAKSMEPHRLTNYLQNISKTFTRFYGAKDNKLKEHSPESRSGLAYLCRAAALSMKEGLEILGISAPEKMEKSA